VGPQAGAGSPRRDRAQPRALTCTAPSADVGAPWPQGVGGAGGVARRCAARRLPTFPLPTLPGEPTGRAARAPVRTRRAAFHRGLRRRRRRRRGGRGPSGARGGARRRPRGPPAAVPRGRPQLRPELAACGRSLGVGCGAPPLGGPFARAQAPLSSGPEDVGKPPWPTECVRPGEGTAAVDTSVHAVWKQIPGPQWVEAVGVWTLCALLQAGDGWAGGPQSF
jgi:hypothetical protein